MATALPQTRLPDPPGPRGLPLIGSLLDTQRDMLKFHSDLRERYGDVVRYQVAGYTGYCISHPNDIERVLRINQHNYPKGEWLNRLNALVAGNGLLASEGELWLQQRRLMQPAFHRRQLALLSESMARASEHLVDRWQPAVASGQPLDVAREMMRLTLEIVGKTLCSIDVRDEVDVISPALTVVLSYMAYRSSHPFAIPERYPTPRNRCYAHAKQQIDTVMQAIIDERRRTGVDHDDLLSMLLHARDEQTGAGMSDAQLLDEVRTLVLAGHETTANALAWTWYLLARNPEVETRLHAELDSVLGGRLPTFDDLPRLQYTRMTIDEALRLYPPAAITGRSVVDDDELGGYHIAGKSFVSFSQYAVHRHPDFWDDPERFDPERFTPERVATRPKFAYFPFGGGPRLCIGNNFALMEAQIVLATIAQRYRLRLVADRPVQPQMVLTLRPRNGVQMTINRR